MNNEDALIQEFAKIANQITGVQFNDRSKTMIKSRLQKRYMDLKLPDLEAYLTYFRANQATETPKLIGLLTTHHTHFFREFSHFEFLISKAIPELLPELKSRPDKTLRVWSAACSRGQEVYSLAMYLDFHLKRFDPTLKFEILGTDIDPESVEIAKNAVYLRTELKEAPLSLLGTHWSRGTGDIAEYVKAKATLRSPCKFLPMNLLELQPRKEPIGKFDLVFCRNVYIYFNDQQIRQITEQLLQRLSPRGFLFVGASESLTHLAMPILGRMPAVYQHASAKLAPTAPQAPTKTQTPARSPSPGPSTTPELEKPIRVLCVDDSNSILVLLKKILSPELGFEVVGTAENGEVAIQKLAELKPDAITLDIHMPVMTGLEFLQKSFRPGHPPVVMLTSVSRDNAELAGQAMALGASDFVEKPALSNIAKRGDEIRAKIRCAVTAQKLSTAISTQLDQSFHKKHVILNPADKLRVVVMSLSQRSKLRGLFAELIGPQPPTFILVDGGGEALAAMIPILTKVAGKVISFAETLPKDPESGKVYLMDLDTHAKALFEQNGKGHPTSILVYGEVPQASAEKILQFQGAHLLLEDLGGAKGTASLMDAANDVVPATSFPYMSIEFLSQITTRKAA